MGRSAGAVLLVVSWLFGCSSMQDVGGTGSTPPEADASNAIDADAGSSSAPPSFDAAAEASAPEGDAGTDAALDAGGDARADAGTGTGALCSDPNTVQRVGGACDVVVASWPDEGHLHYAVGTPIAYCTEPPASGPHYPVWANFQVFTHPVPNGYLVHSLEHGAVVVSYRCNGACPELETSLRAFVEGRPQDKFCGNDPHTRMVLVPDPTLDVPVAAAAWQWTYRAQCFDEASLTAFVDAHYGHGREASCARGVVP